MYNYLSFTKIIIFITIGLAIYIIIRLIRDNKKKRSETSEENETV
jgi:large-conductance mechanosensitive channel